MSRLFTTDDLVPFDLKRPKDWSSPVIFASPHSGQAYPPSFVEASRLDPVSLRRSEDAFVDDLFAAAPELGAPLLSANFPRVFVDPNREPFELDPEMFEDALPAHVNTNSPRIRAGLGTMARVVTSGEEVYDGKLHFADAEAAIQATYMPYHAALKGLLDEAYERFGCWLLVDCQSMPSIGGPMDRDPGFQRVDFILGDRYGASCNAQVTTMTDVTLKKMHYIVKRNNPYAGGFTTAHYGEPGTGRHTLQIEINRALYMNEIDIERTEGFNTLKTNMTELIAALCRLTHKDLAPT